MSRILIAVPTYETIFPDTFKSIYQLDKGDNEVEFDFVRGYDVANARNRIAQLTLDGGYDYVLMIDNDVTVPKDLLVNMLESEQSYPLSRNMVVGYCLSRPANQENQNGKTTVFKFGGKNYTVDNAYAADELKSFCEKGVTKIQVRGSGLACALIHRSVFEKMSYPYFRWVEYNNRTQLSEDLYFCEQFSRIKTPIFVDTRAACGHMMRHIVYA